MASSGHGGLRRDALRAALSLLETARDPRRADRMYALLDVVTATPLMDACFARQAERSDLKELVISRYSAPWPDPDAMRSLRPDSLGACLQRRSDALGLPALRPPAVPEGSDATYLMHRLRITHDIHHLILGLPTTVAGEAAAAAYYAAALQSPSATAVLTAWMTHGLMAPDEHGSIWKGIRFATELALDWSSCLLAWRWEDAWDRPLQDWRTLVGLDPLLKRSPFQEELGRWITPRQG